MAILFKGILFLLLWNAFSLVESAELPSNLLESFKGCVKNNKNKENLNKNLVTDNMDLIMAAEPLNSDIIRDMKIFKFGFVPKDQFLSCLPVGLSVYLIGQYWNEDGCFSEIISAVSAYFLMYSFPKYFGYRPVFSREDENGKWHFTFMFEKINFYPLREIVSYERWLLTPILWVCQVFLAMSDETFEAISKDFSFINYTSLAVTMIMTSLLALGLFDTFSRFFSCFVDSRQ